MSQSFYDRYWQGETDKKGTLNNPPVFNQEQFEKIFNLVKKYLGKSILDVGAGDGSMTFHFSEKLRKDGQKHKIIASEISAEAIKSGKKKFPNLKFHRDDWGNLSFPSNEFDTLLTLDVVEHILDVRQMFLEFNRVLKKKGYLIITTTDFNFPKQIIIALFFWNKFFYPTNPHIRFFNKKTLASVLNDYGFKLINHWWNGSYFRLMPKGQIAIFQKIKTIK